jgi:hypothetical protein
MNKSIHRVDLASRGTSRAEQERVTGELREVLARQLYGFESAGGWAGCPGGCAEKYRRRADAILDTIQKANES